MNPQVNTNIENNLSLDMVSSGLTTSVMKVADNRKENNTEERVEANQNRIDRRFGVFAWGYILIGFCNFSWIPYYYDSHKYGSGQRMFLVIYRHSKLRLFFYCLQVLFLFISICQYAYNGLNLTKYIDNQHSFYYDNNYYSKNNVTSDSFYCSMDSIKESCLSVIRTILTYDRWRPIDDYRRRMNVLMLTFTLNSFAQRVHNLIRHQRAKIHRPKILSHSNYKIGTRTTDNLCEIIMLNLLSFKLTFTEYILYCFLNRPKPEHLKREYPILKKITKQDLLKFDLMTLENNNALICTPKVFINLVRGATICILLVVFETIFCQQILIYILDISNQGTHYTPSGSVIQCFSHICLFLVLLFNISTFADSFILVALVVIISDRLFIFNVQLIQFYNDLRRMSKELNSARYIHNDRNNLQQLLDVRCKQLIIALHQLLFDFNLMKEQFTNRTDIDVLISLCSFTWVLSTWIVAYNCRTCVAQWPILIFTFMGNAYLLNVINQMFFLARLSQKVRPIFDVYFD